MSHTKQAIVILTTMLLGALVRDLFVGTAGAEEDALRRTDVERVVRALESQAKALENQVRGTQELARELRAAGRNCGR